MGKLKALLRSRWFWRALGAILLGLLIWFLGPLVSIGDFRPFEWWPAALFFALLPPLVVAGAWLWSRRRAQRRNAAMIEALKPGSPADHDEIAAKLVEALDMLKSARLGSERAYVYQLPWYAIIGPSGAGKTTALLNSGLDFPTAVAGEYRALRGQPNTPNCDWWFTDEAVLIDTAGRYVTQDIDAAADAEGWRSFLELLKRHRPLQPLNGIIVAIPAPDFANKTAMAAHAGNIRARLAEIRETLGQDLPVYVLITKADLLSGFREYFARSTDAESDQVFGATAPGTNPDSDSVLRGFDALVTSVSSRLVDRMQSEPQLPLRAQMAGFPGQLASLRAPLATLLAALAVRSRFDEPARVRGVYLASGTQTGNPVDRILLGAGLPALASAQAVGQGRSFFLKRFFSDLVIPEQGMAGRNPAAERRTRQRYIAGVAAAGVALTLAIGLWIWGYSRNMALIHSIYATASAYSEATGGAAAGTSVEQDLAALGVLGKATHDMTEAGDFGLGLGQGGRLGRELRGVYGRDLQRRLTPILVGLAEERLAANGTAPAALYDDLKSYLILGGRGPTLDEHVLAWVQSAWTARGGPGAESEAGELARHTAALFDGNFKPVAIDDARIETARAILRTQPPAVRVYGRLKTRAIEKGEPMWTARDNAGPRPELFFDGGGAFAPGAGVPALFTRAGYERTFLPIAASGPKLLEEENWVVGDTGVARLSAAELGALRQDLERLYFAEFLSRWQTYVASLKPRPVTSLADNVQRLRDGSGPLSPIAPLLRAIAKATDLTPGKNVPKPQASAVLPQSGVLGAAAKTAAGAAGAAFAGGGDPRRSIVDAFVPLRIFVGTAAAGGAPSNAPVDALMTTMGQLADKLNVIAVLPGGGGATGSQQSLEAKALILQLDQSANAMPPPAGLWAKAVASDASVALGGARLAQMSGAINASFGEQCLQLLSHAFPVRPAAAAELPLDVFARFFAPQGQFARFVNDDLAGYVDTSTESWQAKPNATEVGLTEANVRALQAANLVTRIFFGGDPHSARLSYQVEPVALAGAPSVTLRIDGQTLTFDGKSPIPVTFEWPGPGGASVEFATTGTAPEVRSWPGQWAAFRLMKAAAVKSGASPAIGEGSLTQAGARFDFRVRTFGGTNPFVLDPFVKIACPSATTGQQSALRRSASPLVQTG
ncbi:type VI secretion system membrane subunit TssM [Sphingomonas parva]|uniref:Type VI secretion system membrane subunit TssM n=1 Tax=Sphingomonas parva TaxID=2555898 RepID=A0A4Y8ZR67_9SPHN|nr:type VI secretion system membrane subunit TssM [Sphingomonas parva]TFI57615.1 type VI secretion system membrane subunit TssM [Sphingomonas parva]